MIGLLAPMALIVGYDCSVHMCKSQLLLIVSRPAELLDSRRDSECVHHPPTSYHGFRHRQFYAGLHHGHYPLFHNWRWRNRPRIANRVSLYSSILQRDSVLCWHQRHDRDHYHHAFSVRRVRSRRCFAPDLVFRQRCRSAGA